VRYFAIERAEPDTNPSRASSDKPLATHRTSGVSNTHTVLGNRRLGSPVANRRPVFSLAALITELVVLRVELWLNLADGLQLLCSGNLSR
jgi:hypothetical protein